MTLHGLGRENRVECGEVPAERNFIELPVQKAVAEVAYPDPTGAQFMTVISAGKISPAMDLAWNQMVEFQCRVTAAELAALDEGAAHAVSLSGHL